MVVHGEGSPVFPVTVTATLLARFPKFKDGEVDWTAFVQICRDQELTDVMVRQHLVGKKALAKLAAENGEMLYISPLLDSLAKYRVPLPRSVWEQFAEGVERPAGLIPPVQLLLRSYANDKAADSDKWFFSYLVRFPRVRDEIIPLLLGSPGLSLRVARKLLDAALPRTAIKQGSHAAEVAGLAVTFIEAAANEIARDGPNAETSAAVIGLFRSARAIGGGTLFEPVARVSGVVPKEAVTQCILAALTRAEPDGGMSVGSAIIPAQGDELYQAVQNYLAKLTSTTQGSDSITRVEKVERYQGRRDVIESLLPVLEGRVTEDRIRDVLEASLFNVGLRAFGEPGDLVDFDFRFHRSDSPQVVPGDQVKVVQPGRKLGEEENAIVLSKALVEPAQEASVV
jgi:hypothetical protein